MTEEHGELPRGMAGLLLAALLLGAGGPVWSAELPGPALFAEKPSVTLMSPFEVKVSVLGSIGVTFTLEGDDPKDPDASIHWASITDVPPGSPGDRAGLKGGDELIRLNGMLIRGMTVKHFAAVIRKESKRGNLVWSVRRGVLGLSFTTIFNGKTTPAGGPFATPDKLPAAIPAVSMPEPIEKMAPFTVEASRSTEVIEVRFMLSGRQLNAGTDDPILEVNVVDAQGEGARLRSSLQAGDALIRLNGTTLRGLTLRQLGALVAEERKKGDLVWEVRRGLSTFSRKFNGPWIRPLPEPARS